MKNQPLVKGHRKLVIPSGSSSVKPYQDDGRKVQHPPEFPLSPRDYIPYPDTEINIQLPSAEPAEPSTSLFSILMPMFGVVTMLIVFAVLSSRQPGGASMTFALFSVPMALFSVIAGIVNYYQGKKKHKAQVEARNTSYTKYLETKKTELEKEAEKQRQASLSAHPDIQQCYDFVNDLTPTKLWDRENGDPDFLDMRLGIGESTSTFSVNIPDPTLFQVTPDPLEVQAREIVKSFSRVTNIAVVLPTVQVGSTGFVGEVNAITNSIRAGLLHLTTHHSPEEMKVVVLSSEAKSNEWDWIRWLPHSWGEGRSIRFWGNNKKTQSSVLTHIENILKQRKNLLENQKTSILPIPAFLMIWDDPTLWRGQSATQFAPVLDMILNEGKKLGVFSLFLAGQISRVPKPCEAIININPQSSTLKLLGVKPEVFPFTPDQASRSQAWQFAQEIAPIRLEDMGGRAANLPDIVSITELIGATNIDELDILDLWHKSEPQKNLSVPIGIGAGGKPLFLNLHEKGHGPHGLVAGTTGSGKTALLTTYLTLAALYYHPHEFGFIGIDFKGGDLIRELQDLPHMIGTMTNLDGNDINRAIKILRGEIKKRQGIFNQAGIGNIYDYQKMRRQNDPKAAAPMPHLTLVCDEFAELKKEQPDFIRELVSIARVGRSLGIHLILATQKPAGVVSEEIWSNSHFHLCLKVASIEDSREMLRRPEAAEITQQGRAYFQVGMNEVFELFQAAWGEAPYTPSDNNQSYQPRIRYVYPDGTREDRWPLAQKTTNADKTQLQEIVSHVISACNQNNIARVEGIWPPSLSEGESKSLQELTPSDTGWNGKNWDSTSPKLHPILGILDAPEQQRQEVLRIDLESNGHLAVFGSPGSGKTTALQTLVMSMVQEHTPEEIQIYLLDFSGRNLTVLEQFPHVGAVITLGENERLKRFFALIIDEIIKRKELIEHDQTLSRYRKKHPTKKIPDIVVVLDGYSHFADAFKLQTITTEIDNIIKLSSQGSNVGIHLIVASSQVKSFPSKLLGNIKDVIATELNDPMDYISVVGRTRGLIPPKDNPGRGLIKKMPVMEFQTALPAKSNEEIKKTAIAMNQAWKGTRPRPVPVLAEIIGTDELSIPVHKKGVSGTPIPIGIDLSQPDLLEISVPMNVGPHFWIAGLPQSGKTTFMQNWLLSIAQNYTPKQVRFCIVDLGWGNFEALGNLLHTIECITDVDEFKTIDLKSLLSPLLNIKHEGKKIVSLNTKDAPAVIFAVDGLGNLNNKFMDPATKENQGYLLALLKARNINFHLLASGTPMEFSGGPTKSIAEILRFSPAGFWLGNGAAGDVYNLPFSFAPGDAPSRLEKGRGFYVNRGKYLPIKFATPYHGAISLEEKIKEINEN